MNKILKTIIDDYDKIESIQDLNKRKLSHFDYSLLSLVLTELATKGQSEFLSKSVADYLSKFKVNIKLKAITYIANI